MKIIGKAVGLIFLVFLLSSCQSSESEESEDVSPEDEADQSQVQPADESIETGEGNDESKTEQTINDEMGESGEEQSNNEDQEESSSEENIETAGSYSDFDESPNYFVESHTYDSGHEFLTAFLIDRNEGSGIQFDERLHTSLIESDPSEQNIFESFSDLSTKWPTLEIYFDAEENELSTTTAQTTLFYDSLIGISDLYGIEEIQFFNAESEQDITVAQRLVDAPIIVKDERGETRGYYTIYDAHLEQTLFLPGGVLDESIVDVNDELLSFPETIEAMGTVENEATFYGSAIVEGLEVVDASYENGVASVEYVMDETHVTEADRIVFERAIQLAALDFHASELYLVNDTLKENVKYPLIEQ
ncbi:hypothetical protein ACFOU0_01840 [Salinicoccus sesuvii]|uniref:Uncharacterized protein n=1 Tax=Salinicoccus sesuvii TaxID=868281 RepID=A0ABV7N3A0_9STAP